MPANAPKILNLVLDQRFTQSPDGNVWTHVPPSYGFFEQPLEVFDHVRVIARTTSVAEPAAGTRRVNGPGVEVVGVSSFVGPIQYLWRRHLVEAELDRISRLEGAFLLRIPSHIAFLLARRLQQFQKSFAVELLTDPTDFFASGVSPHGFAFLFKPYFCKRSRELCRQAIAANFVTGARTRVQHPTPAAHWVGSVSDVDLPAEAFTNPRPRPRARPLELVHVGLLDLLYKGQDVLLRALGLCRNSGLDFRLTFAGDGAHRQRLMSLAASLGIADRVCITGALAGAEAVRSCLLESDLFVLPSRAEGIPRALIEAMAAGLPVIGSNVGAIPDLLPDRWVVPAGHFEPLAAKIMEFSRIPERWAEVGAANQMMAREFERSRLRVRRRQFYEAVLTGCLSKVSGEEFSHAA
jgi:phosphatidyl-myo-inositol dimannoside synthase